MFNQDVLAYRIKQLRKERKLNQEDIGIILNVTKTQISDIEKGKRLTTIENLVILADYFNVSLDYLTGRTDNPDLIINKAEQSISEVESELLGDFRLLNKYEQNIIMGKISEIIYNKNIENNNIEISEELINIDLNERLNK